MTTNTALYEIPVDKIDGANATLKEHSGEVLLLVNVASKCGLTPQYEGLEALQKKFSGQKFSVLGFPANDFAVRSRAATPIFNSSAPPNSASLSLCTPRWW